MDKVKKFLEAYVQWLAILLGVAFLGWTVYGYVLQKPVTVSVGPNQDVVPADVYGKIWSEVGEPLKGPLSGSNVPSTGVDDNLVASVTGPFNPLPHWPVLAADFTPPPVPDAEDVKEIQTPENKGTKIARLPEAPAPINMQISHGHSNVPGPQPVAAAGAPAAPVMAMDRNWVSVEGTLHVADLAKSFKDVGIAPGSTFSSTAMLRVVLIRQTMNANGNWGAEEEVPALDSNPLPALPDMKADFAAQKDYFDFAEKNFIPIAQPPFYQVLQGNVWYEPGTRNPNEVEMAAEDNFNPSDPGAYAGDPNKLLPSERKLYDEAKARQAAKDNAKQRGQNRPPTPTPGGFPGGYPGQPGGGGPGGGGPGAGGRGGGAGSGRGYLGADPQRPPDDRNILIPPGAPIPPGMRPFGQYPGMPGGYPGGMPGGGQPNLVGQPTGSFDPSVQVDFKMWAHDPTVQAGKTYRYKLRYIISNPVARTVGLCNPEALSKQFFITSKDSAWTESISVESDTNFYAVELKHGVHFDVFKWKDGVWQMQSVTVNAGDMVGSVDTNPTTGVKTDFSTGWTLVDIREDPSNNDDCTIVLVSDNGTVVKKDLLTDAHSSKYRELYLLAAASKPAAAQAGGPGNPVQ